MPSLEIRISAATRGVQATGKDVGFDSPVSLLGEKLLELLREAIKLLSGELRDGGLKFFNTHKLSAYRFKSSGGNRSQRRATVNPSRSRHSCGCPDMSKKLGDVP
jgi:hypothetical protein